VSAAEDTLAAAQQAKEAAFALCKASSQQEARTARDQLGALAGEMATARARVIVYVGPQSNAATESLGLTTRLHQLKDVAGYKLETALANNNSLARDDATEEIGGHVDAFDEEISGWAAIMYLAAEAPVWQRRVQAYKQRRNAKRGAQI